MSVKKLIERLPFIAECQDADRFSERNMMVFDIEIDNPQSIFAYRSSDSSLNRLAVLGIPSEYVGNDRLYRYGIDRIKIAMLSQDKARGRISPDQQITLDGIIADHEANPEPLIDDELSLEASVQGIWNP